MKLLLIGELLLSDIVLNVLELFGLIGQVDVLNVIGSFHQLVAYMVPQFLNVVEIMTRCSWDRVVLSDLLGLGNWDQVLLRVFLS